MAYGIELVAGTSPRIRRVTRAVEPAFHEAAEICRARLGASDITVHLVDAPDEVLPEWGLGASTRSPGKSLRERVVEEGLAVVFETEVTGRQPFFSVGPVAEQHRAEVARSLDGEPVDEGRWFFVGGDLPRWLGYALGYDVVSSAVAARGTTAAALVAAPPSMFDPWLDAAGT